VGPGNLGDLGPCRGCGESILTASSPGTHARACPATLLHECRPPNPVSILPLPQHRESSRSHAVFTVVLESREVDTVDGITRARCASFNLVDLAGSERQGQTGACRSGHPVAIDWTMNMAGDRGQRLLP